MNNIKFSVIVPVYNVEKYLNECIDSIINQTYKNLELILVDDGSTDNSGVICDDYSAKDNRIKVVHKSNGGISSARNCGINNATGDYLIFVDSDDYWNDMDFLKTISAIIESKHSDVVLFNYKKSNLFSKKNIEIDNFSDKNLQLRNLISNSLIESQAWTKVVKNELFKKYNLYFIEKIYSEDIDWTARIILYSNSFFYYNTFQYVYRTNPNSVTKNIGKKNIVDLKNQIIRIVELSKTIEFEDYYKWYMNYCAYQYITFLNCVASIDKNVDVNFEIDEMKNYSYLLTYNVNSKVKIVSKFNKVFGYKLTLKILKIFLKLRGNNG